AFYLIIDQTIPISEKMASRIKELVSDWGQTGDMVKIIRFSANYRDQYPEIVFSRTIEPAPTQDFLYNLRYSDKPLLLDCIQKSNENFNASFHETLNKAIKDINPKTPKTDILYSLKQIAVQIVAKDVAKRKIVLIVSDGMENSEVASFYRRKSLAKFDSRKIFQKARRSGLVANWDNAQIYFYGLGLSSDSKRYGSMSKIENLRLFWERIFIEGRANIGAIGAPELLISSIK
ncbi:MAG: hypothetical protein OEZ47_03975, partial [Gammaproteobacteria bacterium]|nr:hypothetical protein [Gammaproteobacteria bacterium]